MEPIRPVAVEAFACRVPIETPLRTSFGTMYDRPAVFVRVLDADGAEGWGEAWCNWPTVGAEHRARLVVDVVGPYFTGRSFDGPAAAYDAVARALEVLVIQTAETGPIAQALAGIDIALHDLAARKAGVPLYRMLQHGRRGEVESVPAYASGLNPDNPEQLALARHADGHRAFKLKIGFARDQDVRNLEVLRKELGRRRDLDGRREPALRPRRRDRDGARPRAVPPRLVRGADPRRRAARGVARAGGREPGAPRRRREPPGRGVRRRDRVRNPRLHPAGCRQVGRRHGETCGWRGRRSRAASPIARTGSRAGSA